MSIKRLREMEVLHLVTVQHFKRHIVARWTALTSDLSRSDNLFLLGVCYKAQIQVFTTACAKRHASVAADSKIVRLLCVTFTLNI